MGRIPFRRRPAFRVLIFSISLAAIYLYLVIWQGLVEATFAGIVFDLILLILLFQLFLFYFAQFTLPLHDLHDRWRIRARLMLHARNAHGPAIFVKNGRKVERPGEAAKSGPGLLWIDSASAVMTRSGAGLKQVLGPGIHFIDAGERVDTAFSLHTQTYSIGPATDEPIFEKLRDGASDDEQKAFAALQAKRMAVSARTRDGHEVVPVIRTVFKLDAMPARAGMPGSRFGFAREAVERAARGEGISPASGSEPSQHVAWNQLPGLIAVDLWREYLGKFTLDELFSPSFPGLPEILQPEEPVPSSSMPETPLIVRRNFPARLLRRINHSLDMWLTAQGIDAVPRAGGQFASRPPAGMKWTGTGTCNALELVGAMMRARMMQAIVPILDECGRLIRGHILSEEHKRLRERGLSILDVTIEGLRFDPSVEDQIVQQWNTTWLANAEKDRRHVEQLEMLAEQAGRQDALLAHAGVLGQAILMEQPKTIGAAVKTLLRATQNEIRTDERLYGRAAEEADSISQVLKWTESSEDE
jgi:hypothetical protein